jgi:hypothetical protein
MENVENKIPTLKNKLKPQHSNFSVSSIMFSELRLQWCDTLMHRLRYRKSQSYPCTGLEKPGSLQEFEVPRLPDSQVASPRQQPHLLPRKYSWCSFLLQAESTPRIKSLKISSDSTGNWTRDLWSCRAVSHPTVTACPLMIW